MARLDLFAKCIFMVENLKKLIYNPKTKTNKAVFAEETMFPKPQVESIMLTVLYCVTMIQTEINLQGGA